MPKKALGVRKFTKEEAVWLACAIDGEGSIGLYTFVGDGRRVMVQMGNTSKAFVQEFRRIIGCGSSIIRSNFKKKSGHKGRKPMHYFSLKGSGRCYAVLQQVIPYLIIKKVKAKRIVKELESKPFGRWQQYAVVHNG